VTLSEIGVVIANARSLSREAGSRRVLTEEGKALLALRDLLVEFLETTGDGSFREMSLDQQRLFHQLCQAVEL
jgi:hypothetical protein